MFWRQVMGGMRKPKQVVGEPFQNGVCQHHLVYKDSQQGVCGGMPVG